MSITKETIQQHLKEPAVFCCQRQKGLIIGPEDLEDPTIFDDIVESGLMTLSDDGLTIEQVLGRKLIVDADALTPITKDMIDSINETSETPEPSIDKEPSNQEEIPNSKMLHIEISKLEGLKLDIPADMGILPGVASSLEPPKEDKIIRTLVKKYYKVNDVKLGSKTSFENGVLTINESIVDKAIESTPLIKDLKIDIITPENRHVFTETIMDVCPIATKVEGKLGEGVSHVLDGAVFMLTGVDEDGVQIHEFGSSEGYLDEKMAFGRPGCADENDIIIRVNAVIQRGTGMERRGPFAAHSAEDVIIQDVRNAIKKVSDPIEKEKTYHDVKKYGKPRVVLIKEIMGQGAMHDNVLCPIEPAGVHGGQKNVDLGNVPVMMTPNQVRDGAIHALTCIGPATKEMTRHYFREPLVEGLAEDEELNLVGVIFVGSPQVNDEKSYVSERLGTLVESLDVEGAIVTTEGFGNNHIDFTSHIEQIGMRGIPVVGVSFCAYQGQLVVGNKYMDAMIEINKDKEGFENEVAGCSSITKSDADRAILMLKTKMAGIPIKPAKHKWNPEIIENNQRIVDEVLKND
ncbi:D-proline reductase (dithiol) proprotein PrdA [Clostridium sp. cel8]|uniref:D-proline reductase (dithiol) proprotein PrdA n=1 Tax=Clostridium sp. cel8 TaxID=2663123 RepID=UPI0015F77E15|nr:D-proline reductase (dithiol) proprotein PrdA [Clostridium sp. cel8]MBA5851633.1 D-proline reductase (dithiol) proprotein PrdA [Clostridium sp. cel8]